MALAFNRKGGVFALNLTIPGNTLAELCLPTSLLNTSTMTINGVSVATVNPAARPGQLCAKLELTGGQYAVMAS